MFRTVLASLLLCSCGTSAKFDPQANVVKTGWGVRTVITFEPDGTRRVEVFPINFFEAITSGITGGLLHYAANKETP